MSELPGVSTARTPGTVSESPCPSLRRHDVMSDPCELLFIALHGAMFHGHFGVNG